MSDRFAVAVVALVLAACTAEPDDLASETEVVTVPALVSQPPEESVPPGDSENGDPDGDGFDESEDFCPKESGSVGGCPDQDGDGVADILERAPASVPELLPLPNPDAGPGSGGVALRKQWFSADIEVVLRDLEEIDLIVIDYPVCSGSVGAGEVRQIIDSSDGTVLLDEKGLTEAGVAVEAGTVIEIKVGTGVSCG